MTLLRHSWVAVFLLVSTGAVRADLAAPDCPAGRQVSAGAPVASAAVALRDTSDILARASQLADLGWQTPPTETATDLAPAVQNLPALPGSSGLFLSAMLSVGAWHAVRRTGNLHFGHLPAWYHAEGPLQIGHRVAFDPANAFDAVPVCLFEVPGVVVEPESVQRDSRELHGFLRAQQFLSPTFPRGPPHQHL